MSKFEGRFNIIEISGTENLEDIILPAIISYINERAGRPLVRIGREGEKTIFEEENHPFKLNIPVRKAPFATKIKITRRDSCF